MTQPPPRPAKLKVSRPPRKHHLIDALAIAEELSAITLLTERYVLDERSNAGRPLVHSVVRVLGRLAQKLDETLTALLDP
jgi:hypothetical protein